MNTALVSLAAASIAGREGFEATPYWDVVRGSIGYGTAADGRTHISEEEAYQEMEDHIYGILSRVNLGSMRPDAADSQHAAIISFLYNVGDGGFDNTGISRAFRDGRDEDVIREMGRWVLAGSEGAKAVNQGLINRRFSEAMQYASSMELSEARVAELFLDGVRQAERRADVHAPTAWTAAHITGDYVPNSLSAPRDNGTMVRRNTIERTQQAVSDTWDRTSTSLGRFGTRVMDGDFGEAFGGLLEDMKDNWLGVLIGFAAAILGGKLISSLFNMFGGEVEEAAQTAIEETTAPIRDAAGEVRDQVVGAAQEVGEEMLGNLPGFRGTSTTSLQR